MLVTSDKLFEAFSCVVAKTVQLKAYKMKSCLQEVTHAGLMKRSVYLDVPIQPRVPTFHYETAFQYISPHNDFVASTKTPNIFVGVCVYHYY